MFTDNKDYYPTPENIIDKMIHDIDFKMIGSILEPSAGVFCKYFLEKVAGIFPDVASGNSLKLQRPDLMHFSIKSDIADID